MVTDQYTHVTRYDPSREDYVTENQPQPRHFEEKGGMSGATLMLIGGAIGIALICAGIIYAKMN